MDDIFLWNWKTDSDSTTFFWFDREDGFFGYRMEYSPDRFERGDEDAARSAVKGFTKHSPRSSVYGPFLAEIPPIIAKIRLMEQRHNRYLERKYHAI